MEHQEWRCFRWADGAGDHARAGANPAHGACILLKSRWRADIENGISVDQILANEIGHQTPLPSLELGLEDVRMVGRMRLRL